MGDKERVEFIRYKWQDAENYNGNYTARHDEVKFLLEHAERLNELESQVEEYQKDWTYLAPKIKVMESEIEKLYEAFDIKTEVHDALNRDYVKVRGVNKQLYKTIEEYMEKARKLERDINQYRKWLNTEIRNKRERDAENAKLGEVLVWYADKENYKEDERYDCEIPPDIYFDGGDLARKALNIT